MRWGIMLSSSKTVRPRQMVITFFPVMIHQLFVKISASFAIAFQKIIAVIIMPLLMIAQVELYYMVKRNVKLEPSSLEEQFGSFNDDE